MIISRRYHFIFLANRKTASTSIAIELSKACGPKDTIAPLGRDEEIRSSSGIRGPQNFIPWHQLPRYYSLRLKRKITGGNIDLELRDIGIHTHISAEQAMRLIDPKEWVSSFKFCFIRNPWDRAISQYFWEMRHKTEPLTLDQFIEGPSLAYAAKRSRDLYTVNNRLAVNRICRFESIHNELSRIYRELGIPLEPSLPKAKSQYRSDKRHYRDILNHDQASQIARIFSREIELGHYTY